MLKRIETIMSEIEQLQEDVKRLKRIVMRIEEDNKDDKMERHFEWLTK